MMINHVFGGIQFGEKTLLLFDHYVTVPCLCPRNVNDGVIIYIILYIYIHIIYIYICKYIYIYIFIYIYIYMCIYIYSYHISYVLFPSCYFLIQSPAQLSILGVLIADAPPHGLEPSGDGFPNGDPEGRDPLEILRNMTVHGITCYTVGCWDFMGLAHFGTWKMRKFQDVPRFFDELRSWVQEKNRIWGTRLYKTINHQL